MLPTITSFMAAHQLTDVTVVADAGMVSGANREALEVLVGEHVSGSSAGVTGGVGGATCRTK